MSQRRHNGGERGGGSSWLPRARAVPKNQQTHRLRAVPDSWGTLVWYDYITPGNRRVRIDQFQREERPLTVDEYEARLQEKGYPVTRERGPAIYFCGCQACFSTWRSWGMVGQDGLLHLTTPDCPHCANDDYTQAEPDIEEARE